MSLSRVLTADERSATQGSRWSFCRLEATNPDGAWLDLGQLTVNGTTPANFINTAQLTKTIDENTCSFSATVRREIGALSLAPLKTDSPLNATAGFMYAPALDLRRRWRLSVAIMPWGRYPASSSYRLLAEGYITTLDIGGERFGEPGLITITGRGLEMPLLKLEQLVEQSYAGAAILSRLQAMLNRWNAGVTVVADTSAPSYYVNANTQAVGALMPALQEIAALPGAVLRYMITGTADVNQFTLFTPNRAPSSPDWTFGPSEYRAIPVNRIDYDGIRNYIPVTYFDDVAGTTTITSPAPEPTTVSATAGAATFSASPGTTIANGAVIVVEGVAYTVSGYSGGTTATLSGAPTFTAKAWVTSASITRYGLLPMPIGLDRTTNITTLAAAGALADAVRADLEFPILEQSIESEGAWFVELYDYVKLDPNGTHYADAQYGGVTTVTHTFAGGTLVTTIGLRGKPAGGYRSWLSLGSDTPRAAFVPEITNLTATASELFFGIVHIPQVLAAATVNTYTKSVTFEIATAITFASVLATQAGNITDSAATAFWFGSGLINPELTYYVRATPYSGPVSGGVSTGIAGAPVIASTRTSKLTPTKPDFDAAVETISALAAAVGAIGIPTVFVNVPEDDQWLALSTIPTAEVEVGTEFRRQRYLLGAGSVRLNANIKTLTGTPTMKLKYTTNAFGAVADLVTWTPPGTGLRSSPWATLPSGAKADVGLTLYVADGADTAALDLYELDAEFLPTTVAGGRVHTAAFAPAFN